MSCLCVFRAYLLRVFVCIGGSGCACAIVRVYACLHLFTPACAFLRIFCACMPKFSLFARVCTRPKRVYASVCLFARVLSRVFSCLG